MVRNIYKNFGWSPSVEHKWNSLDPNERSFCAAELRKLCDSNLDIILHAIVVKKQNVLAHIQKDSNKLYNYMVRLALIKRMAKHDVVTMIPDPRSIKVKSGNSLHDYLQTVLWFEEKASTNLLTCPQDSAMCKGIQMADFLAGMVQTHFEDNVSRDFVTIQSKLNLNRLFF